MTLPKLVRVFFFFSFKVCYRKIPDEVVNMLWEEFLQREDQIGDCSVIHDMTPAPHLPASVLAGGVPTRLKSQN